MDNKNEQRTPLTEQLMTVTAVAALILLTLALLVAIAIYGGPSGANRVSEGNLGVVERFYMHGTNAISDSVNSVEISGGSGGEAAGSETVSGTFNVDKKYWISGDSSVVPPKPNKEGFGTAEDPAQLTPVIAHAEKLLNGQQLYFSADMDVYKDFGIRYYQDETILVITWKMPIGSTMYTFSEVKIADPSQFRRFLSGGGYGSGKLEYPTAMAGSVNAVVASSGDYFEFRDAGVIVYDGSVCRVGYGADTCYIDKKGDLSFTRTSDMMNLEKAKRYVEENEIQFSIAFGPVLVENGERNKFGGYGLGEVNGNFSRAALCQMDDLHYLLVHANPEGQYQANITMYEFANRIHETGCRMAYGLDGGQTAAHVMNNVLVNQVAKGFQRKISDIIYFATAIPNS